MWLGCSADWKLIIKKLHYLSKLSLTMSTREEGIEIEKEYKKSLIACKKKKGLAWLFHGRYLGCTERASE